MIVSKLSTLMGEKRISKAELSRMTGLAPLTIRNLYESKFEMIHSNTLENICKALNCQPGDIIKRSDKE